MKKIITALLLMLLSASLNAQYEALFHPASFKRFKGLMHSNPYKPDESEKPLLKASLRNVFPSDITNNPGVYMDTPIHWIGIVKNVTIQDSNAVSTVVFTLEQKYWDYIEDYSIQDEVMFVSPEGEGDFHASVQLTLTEEEKESIKKMPDDKTLLLCYGRIMRDEELPALRATYIKTVDYKYYSTKIFSYKVKRDAEGHVVMNKSGGPELDEFKMLQVAKAGQNKN